MATEGETSEAAKREERILSWWEEHDIFNKSLQKPAPNGEFIFYEGPPTANGRPGIHHLESRAFKDAIPRYKTMRGHHVARRAGWDTHGLPVELEVEKQLGFTGKPDIEKYGVAAFNAKCRESVGKYIDEWSRFTSRMGYWVDQTKAYFTYDAPYMESLWNIVKGISEDGRLYKDYKVLPWCARCGTALSSHELAQGYEEVKDLSITAKFELVDEPGTFLLAWTTTPWTLPGNVALAVGEDISYVSWKAGEEKYIVAENLAEKHFPDFDPSDFSRMETVLARQLIGKKYKPLYDFLPSLASDGEKQKFEKAYQVYAADFVTTEDGTGIVHTAVMYGADDFTLGTEVGLPKVHAVGADGNFIKGAGFLEGRFVKDEEVAIDIVKDLAHRGLLFDKSKHEHTYPFCWRCKTPLIYYARDSWYIRMHDLRDTLLSENAKVHWEPAHIRDGRMGEWLANVKDWAISRERYWGTPLPVWESEGGSERMVIGSLEELKKHTKKSGNRYFVMRHGESESNVQNIFDPTDEKKYPLTEAGKEKAVAQARVLKKEGVTRIFASPFARTKETAEIVANEVGINVGEVHYDPRLRELQFGTFAGSGKRDEYFAWRESHAYDEALPEGESFQDAKVRFGEFLYELEGKYTNECILIVTHGIGLEAITVVVEGVDKETSKQLSREACPMPGEMKEFAFVPLPHNDEYELDLHRPYIDDVVLTSASGKELRRVKEVMDVWFDSGAMPFAQDHYPFHNKEWVEGKGFPADYISEAIDQTRGWFYTLLAVGVLTKRGHAFKNVICLGHLLDKEGKKMSKSKGNVIDPWAAMDMWGVDVLRFWMFSVNQPGDSKSFDDKTVKEAARTLSWFENSVSFYELFKEGGTEGKEEAIDRWMHSRANETVLQATRALDSYDLYTATRKIHSLCEDLSQWYLRRIRDRVREGDAHALARLRETLQTCALLLAPFAPFLAEDAWQTLRSKQDPESVHLASWPTAGPIDEKLMEDMSTVRETASRLLKLRQEQQLIVRQPLRKAIITANLPKELLTLIQDEVNVKEIEQGEVLSLDTVLTPDLILERDEREMARAVAEARKTLGYSPKDSVEVTRGEGPYTVELSTGTVSFDISRNAT